MVDRVADGAHLCLGEHAVVDELLGLDRSRVDLPVDGVGLLLVDRPVAHVLLHGGDGFDGDGAGVGARNDGGLRTEGFTAFGLADAPDVALILSCVPDLTILDVGLPSGDGFTVARELRARRETPILFLTARDAVADRVAGLELGADDYLVKPFALEELLARARAVLRRTGRLSAVLAAIVVPAPGSDSTANGPLSPSTRWRIAVRPNPRSATPTPTRAP
jgi:CheY-like chemotaxis protein